MHVLGLAPISALQVSLLFFCSNYQACETTPISQMNPSAVNGMEPSIFSFTGTGAIFHGCLSTELPADRSAKYSGYCAVRSRPKKVSKYMSRIMMYEVIFALIPQLPLLYACVHLSFVANMV